MQLYSFLRFDKRFLQFLRLFNFRRQFEIYGWLCFLFIPLEIILGIFHIFGVSFLIELSSRWQARKLTANERQIASFLFSNQISLDEIRVYENSWLANRLRIAFVIGNSILVSRQIPSQLFAHEITHVFQFQQVGLVYLLRCLHAQRTVEGYEIGSLQNHHSLLQGDSPLAQLNYEQQAELMAAIYDVQFHDIDLASNEASPRGMDLRV